MPYHRRSAIPGKRGRQEISIIGTRGTQWLTTISRSSAAASTAPASPATPPAAAFGAGRAERSGLRHLVGIVEADPWRLALSRALRIRPGAHRAEGARGAVARGAASDPAAALRAAGERGAALGAGAAPRPSHLRLDR